VLQLAKAHASVALTPQWVVIHDIAVLNLEEKPAGLAAVKTQTSSPVVPLHVHDSYWLQSVEAVQALADDTPEIATHVPIATPSPIAHPFPSPAQSVVVAQKPASATVPFVRHV